jgi:hypothetical protein
MSPNDLILADMLRRRGSSSLTGYMADEKAREFFWGLTLEPEWNYALPLANAILKSIRGGRRLVPVEGDCAKGIQDRWTSKVTHRP